jgi:L-histidine N-alpha-methyltransferase
MRATGAAPVTVRRLSATTDWRAQLAADVAAGMARTPKSIPSKYFYDARGSELFDLITLTPEYYLTRAETEILKASAGAILRLTQPDEIIELGSGSSAKTRLLIEAMWATGRGHRYVPIDISEDALTAAALGLCTDYQWLAVDGLVGDFTRDLPLLPRRGRRLMVFLGSTIGNMTSEERHEFLRLIEASMERGDAFLVGLDLVKQPDVLVAAYNDASGLTAEFTRNVLAVINRELGADFDLDGFTHLPVWNPDCSCMEAWLRADRPMRVRISALGQTVRLEAGEVIHTERSCKFERQGFIDELARAGLHLDEWFTDPKGWFALACAGLP